MKRALFVAAATLACMSASAAAVDIRFVFSHLCTHGPAPITCIELPGEFAGNDTNHDGAISRDELISLSVDGFPTFPEFDFSDPFGGSSGSTHSFSFSAPTSLTFSTSSRFHKLGVVTVVGDRVDIYMPFGDQSYFWNQDTVLTLTAVPEPACIMLMAIGLVGLAISHRNR